MRNTITDGDGVYRIGCSCRGEKWTAEGNQVGSDIASVDGASLTRNLAEAASG